MRLRVKQRNWRLYWVLSKEVEREIEYRAEKLGEVEFKV